MYFGAPKVLLIADGALTALLSMNWNARFLSTALLDRGVATLFLHATVKGSLFESGFAVESC